MNKAQKRSEQIIQKFSNLSNWEERYKLIIQLGKTSLLPFPNQYKTSEYLVKGCQSQLWLYASQNKDKQVVFKADSDSLITKGLVALLLQYYSYLLPAEIISYPVPDFFKTLELQNHLTPTRVGGLFSMLRQIQYYAHGFSQLSKY